MMDVLPLVLADGLKLPSPRLAAAARAEQDEGSASLVSLLLGRLDDHIDALVPAGRWESSIG
jgi:hypothetical protein